MWQRVSISDYWSPEESGEEVQGVFRGLQDGEPGDDGKAREHIRLDISIDGDPDILLISGSQQVRRFVEKISLGERVRIVFGGYKQLGGGKRLKQFSFFVDRP